MSPITKNLKPVVIILGVIVALVFVNKIIK